MKKPDLKGILSSRNLRRGGISILLILLVVTAVVLVNVGVSMLDKKFALSVDLSANRMYSISAQTKKTVSAITTPVKMYALMSQGNEKVYITEMLENYKRINPGMISYEVVDPVKNPTFAKQFTDVALSEDSIIVTNEDGTKVRAIDSYEMFDVGYDSTNYTQYLKAFKGEQTVTNAIVFVTADSVTNAYFLTGHQETPLENFSYVTQLLQGENLAVSSVSAIELDKLQKGDVLIVVSPKTDLTSEEFDGLKAFLADDGLMLYLADPGTPALPYFESLLELYNVTFSHDLVLEGDAQRYYTNQGLIVPNVNDNAVTAGLTQNNQFALLPYATSFTKMPVQSYGFMVDALLTTSDSAYGKLNLESTVPDKEEGDLAGPLVVGYVIHKVDEDSKDIGTKIVLLGNSTFITNQNYYSFSGNADLFMGAVKYLVGQTDTVSIIGKNLMGNSLRFTTATQVYTLVGIVVVVVPLLVIIAGFVVWLRRRHL